MATNEGTITVGIESVVHSVLADVVQRIFDQHGIRVTRLEVQWRDCSTIEAENFSITQVLVESVSRGALLSEEAPAG